MDVVVQDIRIALRRLFHSRRFAAMAIGMLAIGIGANTAVFTVINAVRIRPLPFAQPDRLVDLYEHNPVDVCQGCGVGTSYANFFDWRRTARSFSALAAHDERPVSVGLADGTTKRRAAFVSADVFPLLGVMPVRGRFFTSEEETSGAHVALIGHGMARAAFGAEANPVGETIRVDGENVVIIGVMPERFVFPEHADLWVPLAASARNAARNDRSIGVVARLADGISIDQAAAEMTAIGKQLATEHVADQQGWNAFVSSLHEDLARDYAMESTLLLAAVSCVLLIACANLASLMLARTMARRSELAVRAALGATRMSLARQLLVETMIVSLAGGALGLVVAMWGTDLLQSLAGDALPRWIRYNMDWRVFGFALGLSLLTGVAFGVLPAHLASKASVHDILKDGGRSATGGRRASHAREVLVVLQVAVAFVLVLAAGLLTRTMLESRSLDMGYELAHLVRADIGTTGPRYDDGSGIAAFADRLVSELGRSRDVTRAAMSGTHFLNWPGTPTQTVTIDDVPPDQAAKALHRINVVTSAYFETIGISVLSGRSFNANDVHGSMPVAVVSSTLAHTLWGERPAVGRHIRIGNESWTVVGVAGDLKESPLGAGYSPLLYFPLAQHPVRQPAGQPLTLMVRVASDADDNAQTGMAQVGMAQAGMAQAGMAQRIRTSTRTIDPDVTSESVMTMDAFLRQWQAPVRILAYVASALGVFACFLAAIGIYAVVAFIVAQRTHEIGIRMALGASVRDVMRLMLQRGAMLAGLGTILGLIGAMAFAKTLGYLLFGVSPTDPLVYTIVAFGFLGVALLAAWIPAQHASRVNPTEALRAE